MDHALSDSNRTSKHPLASHMGVLMATGAGVQTVQEVFLLLLLCVAVFAGLARRLKVPYPILLVTAGLLLSFLPGMPRIGLDPSLVFLCFCLRCCIRLRGRCRGGSSSGIL